VTQVVNNLVNTRFSVDEGSAAHALLSLSSVSATASREVDGLVGMLKGSLTSALAGLAVGLTAGGIARLGGQFENTTNVMGGTLSALGFTKGDDPTMKFTNGLKLAEGLMKKINATAAALPGETDEYVSVFKQSLAAAAGSIKDKGEGQLDAIVAFTNRATAIGKSLGIDAQQIGMDLTRMLQVGKGAAGMDVRLWTTLLPFVGAVQGQVGLTAEKFNKMTQAARGKVLEKTFETLQPLIDRAAQSYDALKGTFEASMTIIARTATAPLFEAMKGGLIGVNGLLMDADGNLVGLGKTLADVGFYISKNIVGGFRSASEWIDRMGTKLSSVLPSGNTLLATLQGDGGGQAGRASRGGTEMGAMLDVAIGPVLGAFAIFNAPALLAGVMSLGPILSMTGTALWSLSWPVLAVSAGVVVLGNALMEIVAWVMPLADGFAAITGTLLAGVLPVFAMLYGKLAALGTALGNFLGPIVQILGAILMKVYEGVAWLIVPVFQVLGSVLGYVIDGFTELLNFIGGWLGNSSLLMGKAGGDGPGFFERMQAGYRASQAEAAAKEASEKATDKLEADLKDKAATPPNRGGSKVNQDFRYSRFDISQKFEEGFDPDRIAVLFAEDVGRIGYTNSGLEPTTGMR